MTAYTLHFPSTMPPVLWWAGLQWWLAEAVLSSPGASPPVAFGMIFANITVLPLPMWVSCAAISMSALANPMIAITRYALLWVTVYAQAFGKILKSVLVLNGWWSYTAPPRETWP